VYCEPLGKKTSRDLQKLNRSTDHRRGITLTLGENDRSPLKGGGGKGGGRKRGRMLGGARSTVMERRMYRIVQHSIIIEKESAKLRGKCWSKGKKNNLQSMEEAICTRLEK